MEEDHNKQKCGGKTTSVEEDHACGVGPQKGERKTTNLEQYSISQGSGGRPQSGSTTRNDRQCKGGSGKA